MIVIATYFYSLNVESIIKVQITIRFTKHNNSKVNSILNIVELRTLPKQARNDILKITIFFRLSLLSLKNRCNKSVISTKVIVDMGSS